MVKDRINNIEFQSENFDLKLFVFFNEQIQRSVQNPSAMSAE